MKLIKKSWLILSGVALAVVLFAAFAMNRKDKTQYFTGSADRGDIREVVEATGTINAVTSVQVGSQVSGMIYRLHADFNSRVRKGELIAEIEPSLFQGAVLQAQADLENAKANLATAKANLVRDKATQSQVNTDYQRSQGLSRQGIVSQQQLDLAKATSEAADAAVLAGDATVKQAAAQVSQRDATLSVAKTNLDHCFIYAPIDGTVVNRAVDVGQTVAASLQAPTLFTIAQDLTKMQVYTATDESDVGMIHTGQRVTFKVDAFPRDTFLGVVSQVRMNPTTVQNVVTYNTIIDFDNPELKLFPGMTAYVTIPVAAARDVLRVPNGALRYNPDMKVEELRALLKQNGIETGGGGGRRQQASAASGGGDRQGGTPPDRAASGAQGGTQAEGQGGRMAGAANRAEGERPGGGMAAPRESRQDLAIVWKMAPDRSLKPVQIRTGITDHTLTEVVQLLHGELKEGDELVVGAAVSRSTARPMGAPGVGGRPPGR